ncbi:hypothetical protein IEO21_05532 [Rhodonia placenta]|uniref:Uncharacterized protein n=1 Tax=Rhodonia placenta TaxID=104341 RepID=A0A8H7P1R7_9APHY|nr:hypothetical protein IEO21_05532 [Postia placenta]
MHPLAYPPATPTPELRASPPGRSPGLLAHRRDGFHHRARRASLHGESANGRTRARTPVFVSCRVLSCVLYARRGQSSPWEPTRRAARRPASLPGDLPCTGRDSCIRQRDVVPACGQRARARAVSMRSPRRVSANDLAPWPGHSHTALSRARLQHDAVCSAGHALCMSRRLRCLPCRGCACTPAPVLCGSGQYGRAASA